ncbi:MAG: MBL fold metallo-hydrolase [Planctomycetota bacterium]
MRLKFWGTRGSIGVGMTNDELREKLRAVLLKAAPGDVGDPVRVDAFIGRLPFIDRKTVGGNTACVEVSVGESLLVFDAGSGLRLLGAELLRKHGPHIPFPIHVFLSHFHWDHIQGFSFFAPAFIKGNRVRFYSPNKDAYALLKRQQDASYFPVKFEDFGADIEFVSMDYGRPFTLDEVTISTLSLTHPGSSTGYRVSDGRAALVYMSDTEIITLDNTEIERYRAFVRGADAAIVDAQYDFEESHIKRFWGHSSPFIFLDILKGAGVGRVFMFHHDPGNTDRDIYDLHQRARQYKELNCPDDKAEILIAIEGDEYLL